MSDTLLGFHRLLEMHRIQLVQPLHTRSRLGAVRQREIADGQESAVRAVFEDQD